MRLEGKKRKSVNGRILTILLFLAVASQFDGAAFESIAKVTMYGVWIAVFCLYCFTQKRIYKTRYVLIGMLAMAFLVAERILASFIITDYNPPIVTPFITSLLFYIVGMFFFKNGLSSKDLQESFTVYCVVCALLGLYIWLNFYGDIGAWFNTDVNIYGKKNSAGQIMAVGVLSALFYLPHQKLASKIFKIIVCGGLAFMIMIIHCRTALLALSMAIIAYLYLLTSRRQKKIIVLGIPVILIILFSIPSFRTLISQALYISKYTETENFTINAFTSNRFDWFEAAYGKFIQSEVTIFLGIGRSYVDNLFINVLTSSGVIGFIIIVIVYVNRFYTNFKYSIISKEFKLLKVLSFFYIVESLAEGLPPFGPGAASVVFWLLCGYCDILYKAGESS